MIYDDAAITRTEPKKASHLSDTSLQIPLWMMSLQKNILFCDGEVFFLDRRLLMGASIYCVNRVAMKQEANPKGNIKSLNQ